MVLLRISAFKIVDPVTGNFSLVYAQLDSASQATLISEALESELGRQVTLDPAVSLRTLTKDKGSTGGRTSLKLESLYSGEQFTINDALVLPQFSDDKNTLPHAVDVSGLEDFEGVYIPVVPERRGVDLLIGQCDNTLLIVPGDRESMEPQNPNYVLTKLGPIASGGRVSHMSNSIDSPSALRVKVDAPVNVAACDCKKIKENFALKQALRKHELSDEIAQPSKNDERAYELTKPEIKVKNGRYEIPVPFKLHEFENLVNNFDKSLKRTLSLHKTAERNL